MQKLWLKKKQKMPQFLIRSFMPEDKNFIYSTWLRGLYFGNDYFGAIPSQVFFSKYSSIVEKVLALNKCEVYVACLPDAKDVILGYAILYPGILHWIFVKDSWRKLGIAKALVPKDTHSCTHLTMVGTFLKNKYKLIFNPFLLGETDYESEDSSREGIGSSTGSKNNRKDSVSPAYTWNGDDLNPTGSFTRN